MSEQADLDRVLAAWASETRLPAAEVDSIRRRILAEPRAGQAAGGIAHTPTTGRPEPRRPGAGPDGLPVQWWQTFSLQVADIIVAAQCQPAKASPVVVLG